MSERLELDLDLLERLLEDVHDCEDWSIEDGLALIAIARAAKELVAVIEHYRPLEGAGAAPGAYDRIHAAQDKVIAALAGTQPLRDKAE
jgi:hypothetical protein